MATNPTHDPYATYVDKGFAASGHAPATDEDYRLWGGYWNDWGSGDPDYFLRKIVDVSGPNNNYGAGWPGSPAGAPGSADPLVYKTLPQVSSALTPQLPSYAGGSLDAKPGATFDQAPPASRMFGSVGGAANLDPRAVQRDALVKMLGRRG